ncbi:MAG: outer membrane beta-barrel protein [Prevotella sp.]
MKRIRLMAVITLLSVCAGAFAQFTNSSSSNNNSSSDGWSSLWVQYNPSTFNVDIKDADNQNFTGLSVGYSKAFSITQGHPLFVEIGLGLQYSFYTNDDGTWTGFDEEDIEELREEGFFDPKEKFNMFSVKVPVALTYKFDLNNSNVSLLPFVGVNLRYNLSGKGKCEWNLGSEYKEYKEYLEDIDMNLFDKKDMGSSDATWKRFQIGWQIGLNAHIGKGLVLGASYGKDFSEIYKKCKISSFNINLGYKF